MTEHPILLLCEAIPEEWVELSGELIDKLHLIFSATNIYHSKDRDECFKLMRFLEELELIEFKEKPEIKKLLLQQTFKTKEILRYHGK